VFFILSLCGKIIEELENYKSEKKPGTDGLTMDDF